MRRYHELKRFSSAKRNKKEKKNHHLQHNYFQAYRKCKTFDIDMRRYQHILKRVAPAKKK